MATKKKPLDWALAPAPESKDHFKLREQYDLFIGGKWVKPRSGNYFDTINPANEQKIARIAEVGQADVNADNFALNSIHWGQCAQPGAPNSRILCPEAHGRVR